MTPELLSALDPSGRALIIDREITPGRITVVLVDEVPRFLTRPTEEPDCPPGVLGEAGEEIHVVEDSIQANAKPAGPILDLLFALQPESRQIEAGGEQVVKRPVEVAAKGFEGVRLYDFKVVAYRSKPGVDHR